MAGVVDARAGERVADDGAGGEAEDAERCGIAAMAVAVTGFRGATECGEEGDR